MDSREQKPQLMAPPHHHLYHHHHHHQQQAAPPPHMMLRPTHPSPYPTMIHPNVPPSSTAAAAAGFPFNSMVVRAPSPPPPPPPQSKLPPPSDVTFDGLSPTSSGTRFSIEPAKKKRGRPRKYTPDGNIALGLATTPISSAPTASVGQVKSGGGVGTTPVFSSSDNNQAKRHRGRPPSSVKRQLDALGGVGGIGFTPHVILVEAGEDIAAKIYSFSQQGPRTICILSASGAISNVTLRQPAMSGGTVTYEGRYEIISLSGSFWISENNGNKSRTGGLSVSLAGSDGRVLGGGVAGMLMAATPVQIIVGSFVADSKKADPEESKSGPSLVPTTQMLNFGGPMSESSPPFQGASSESSDDHDSSPLNQGAGMYNNPSQQPTLHGMQMYQVMAGQNHQ